MAGPSDWQKLRAQFANENRPSPGHNQPGVGAVVDSVADLRAWISRVQQTADEDAESRVQQHLHNQYDQQSRPHYRSEIAAETDTKRPGVAEGSTQRPSRSTNSGTHAPAPDLFIDSRRFQRESQRKDQRKVHERRPQQGTKSAGPVPGSLATETRGPHSSHSSREGQRQRRRERQRSEAAATGQHDKLQRRKNSTGRGENVTVAGDGAGAELNLASPGGTGGGPDTAEEVQPHLPWFFDSPSSPSFKHKCSSLVITACRTGTRADVCFQCRRLGCFCYPCEARTPAASTPACLARTFDGQMCCPLRIELGPA